MVEVSDPLTREQLKCLLDENAFDPSAYSLFCANPSEAYVLDQRGGQWVVCYSERGLETGLAAFPTEALACRHLAELLGHDRTTGA